MRLPLRIDPAGQRKIIRSWTQLFESAHVGGNLNNEEIRQNKGLGPAIGNYGFETGEGKRNENTAGAAVFARII
jgi:hypothetical protein